MTMKRIALALLIGSILLLSFSCAKKEKPGADAVEKHRVTISDRSCTFKEQMLYLVLALQVYRLHVGAFPSSANNIEALVARPNILEATGGWDGPYAESDKLFIDPWDRKLAYSIDSNGKMDLRSLGPDGVRSGDDLVAADMFPDIYKELDKLDRMGPVPVVRSASAP